MKQIIKRTEEDLINLLEKYKEEDLLADMDTDIVDEMELRIPKMRTISHAEERDFLKNAIFNF